MSKGNYKRVTDLPHQLANEHWDWVVRWLEMVYKDAFIHGFKHGVESQGDKTPEALR